MVLVACTVEDDLLDASGLGALSDELAYLGSLGLLIALECTHVGFHGGSGSQGVAGQVIDDLNVHVAGGAVNDQTRCLRGAAEGLTDAEVAARACFTTTRQPPKSPASTNSPPAVAARPPRPYADTPIEEGTPPAKGAFLIACLLGADRGSQRRGQLLGRGRLRLRCGNALYARVRRAVADMHNRNLYVLIQVLLD